MKQIGKNWHKRKTKSTSPHYWYNRKIKSHLYLYRENYKADKFNKRGEIWEVLLIDEANKEKKSLGDFETKKPAMEFMEKWMEEHQK